MIDHKLVEFAFRIPSRLKVKRGKGKYILTEAAKDILPREVVERKKRGFELPIASWLKNELHSICTETLSTGSMEKRGLFKPDKIEEVYQKFLT